MKQQRNKIGAHEIVENADSLQFGCPSHAGPVAEDKVAGVENGSILRIGRRKDSTCVH